MERASRWRLRDHAESDLRCKEVQLRGLHFAAQQRTEPKFELDGGGP